MGHIRSVAIIDLDRLSQFRLIFREQGEVELRLVAIAAAAFFAASMGAQAASNHPASQKIGLSPHNIPEAGTLQATDLIAIAKLGSKGAEDKFSDNQTLKYVGRDFVITVTNSDISSSYDRDSHKLTLTAGGYADGWELGRSIKTSHYSGQNGFGARALVEKRKGDVWGVEIPGPSYSRKPITYSTELEGDAARAFSKIACLRVSGKVKKSDGVYAVDGSAVSKHSIIADATVSEPTDVWITQWFVAIEIEKTEWINCRTTALLPQS